MLLDSGINDPGHRRRLLIYRDFARQTQGHAGTAPHTDVVLSQAVPSISSGDTVSGVRSADTGTAVSGEQAEPMRSRNAVSVVSKPSSGPKPQSQGCAPGQSKSKLLVSSAVTFFDKYNTPLNGAFLVWQFLGLHHQAHDR